MKFKAKTKNGKLIVGELIDGVYKKKVKKSKHFFKMYDGYGIDEGIVLQLLKEGCKQIEIEDTETGEVWTTTPEKFKEKGIVRSFGYGVQSFLNRQYFTIENTRVQKLL